MREGSGSSRTFEASVEYRQTSAEARRTLIGKPDQLNLLPAVRIAIRREELHGKQ